MIVENVRKRPRDHPHLRGVVPDPFHRVGLSSTGLAVGEDGPVEALKDGVDQRSEGLFV